RPGRCDIAHGKDVINFPVISADIEQDSLVINAGRGINIRRDNSMPALAMPTKEERCHGDISETRLLYVTAGDAEIQVDEWQDHLYAVGRSKGPLREM